MSYFLWSVASPNGRLVFELHGARDGAAAELSYRVIHDGVEVVTRSRLGIEHSGAAFAAVTVSTVTDQVTVADSYRLVHGKRRAIESVGNERTVTLHNETGEVGTLIIRAYDDGVAFRYQLDGAGHPLHDELTEFSLPAGLAWIQPHDDPGQFTPAYEARYGNGIAIGTQPEGPSWNLPALFHVRDRWLLLAEADLVPPGMGVHLSCDADGRYVVVPPEPGEGNGIGEVWPTLTEAWRSPWRVIVVAADLAPIVATTLITDLATPSEIDDTTWIHPGRASWSWWSDHDSPQSLPALRRYIDFAADMGWEHSLVDANWDTHPEEAIRELVTHGRSRGVGVWLWYNSGGAHNEVTERPRDRMDDPVVRRAEFAKLAAWGVAGVKVDFFQSDKPHGIQLIWDILSDAAEHKIMVNLHGCTVPRGWQRTWPHLMTVEGVRGGEQYAFAETYPETAPWHNTILPYTRNVIGPMDYTPVTISDQLYPHLTSAAHELALGLLYESGVQHYADSIEAYRALPAEAIGVLERVPAVWDEVRHLSGYPGHHCVIARRHGSAWYLAGIAAQEPVDLDLDLAWLGEAREGLLITDRQNGALAITRTTIDPSERWHLRIPGRGGFVLELR